MLHQPFWQYHILIYKISKRKTQQYAHTTEQGGTVRLENGTFPRLRKTKRLQSGTHKKTLQMSFSRLRSVENAPTVGIRTIFLDFYKFIQKYFWPELHSWVSMIHVARYNFLKCYLMITRTAVILLEYVTRNVSVFECKYEKFE